ncbi:nucleotide-binding alpha-beta plait domain-containing protein [Artemisia annua]|uniref:Nucleotide-binding alpha-beta plait domain-containing protein n=1 Tax=Artemisia annua TaxID=35608 RepID=A0A2U1MD78_ARTAN|nr:nucleotide-binding alpha-beta plait domain-containing protein [Artemisia annua]
MGDSGWTEVRRKNRNPAIKRGKFRSKEDDVARLSTSVFISNIPESIMAKDLFHACSKYGHVVDSFIPFKRDKNVKTGLNNGVKLNGNKATNAPKESSKMISKAKGKHSYVGNVKNDEYSYVNIVKNEAIPIAKNSPSDAVLVLGDEYVNDKNFALSLFGRVKTFVSLANLKVAIANEGFEDIVIKYMGEQWVLLEFQSVETINKFKLTGSIASWFSQIINISKEFEVAGRIAWVEVEGVPLKLWTSNTFSRIAAKWGKLLDVDDHKDKCYHSKRLCILMNSGRLIKEEFKITHRSKYFWIRANETIGWVPDFIDDDADDESYFSDGSDIKRHDEDEVPMSEKNADNDDEVELVQETVFDDTMQGNNQGDGAKSELLKEKSEDLFGLYDLLNKVNRNESNSGTSIKFPPGFTPSVDKEEGMVEDGGVNHNSGTSEPKIRKVSMKDDDSGNQVNMNFKDDEKGSSNSGHFKKSGFGQGEMPMLNESSEGFRRPLIGLS